MKVKLDWPIIPELEKIKGGRFELDSDILKYLFDNCIIDRKFNQYLKGKSVIIVGPSPYMLEQEKADFIESFDVVVRLNKGWKVQEDRKKYLGERTDVRYHCGMIQMQNGGPWEIPQMLEQGVEWACIQFPKHLDYFHNDILRFEQENEKYNMNFHCWSDLELYMSIHHYLGTRLSIGAATFTDLIFYDLERLHISGVTFLEDGWSKGYGKDKKDYAKSLDTEDWEKYKTFGSHAFTPQRKLLKLLMSLDDRITLDKEVKEVIKND